MRLLVKIILDTNFLLIPGSFKVDIFSEIRKIEPLAEFYIIDKTIEELNKIIEKQALIFKRQAKIALELVDKFNVRRIETKTFKNVDQTILEIAKENGYAVATQDGELKKALKEQGIDVFVLRQKKYIAKV